MRDFFYRPQEGFVGDVIPYYENGVYYLYFLYAHRDPVRFGEGTSWYLLTTRDLVHFEEHGEVLPHAGVKEQDLNAFTGSVWKEGEGHYYLFYTGYNAAPRWCVRGVPLQAVMMAESADLLHWSKLPERTFYPSEEWYDLSDWRDPFVCRSEEKGEYRMLLAAREKEGPQKRRGCVGLCTSRDLLHWQPQPPFYAPGLAMTHECPELFRMGDWWYLFYSSFTEDFATHYRMSRSPEGPWLTPPDDTADGRAFYAGKTASDGSRRYLFGWIPTRKGERDDGAYEWAGSLAVHELRQKPDGTLCFMLPEAVSAAFGQETDMGVYVAREKNSRGGWRLRLWDRGSRSLRLWDGDSRGGRSLRLWDGGRRRPEEAAESRRTGHAEAAGDQGRPHALQLDGTGGFACAVSCKELPVSCRISVSLRFSQEVRQTGLLLLTDEEGNDGYCIRLEPARGRMVFDRWPRRQRQEGEDAWEIGGEVSHYVELERPAGLVPGEACRLEILLDRSIAVAYLQGEKAMSARCCGRGAGRLGLFAAGGGAAFEEVSVWRRE